MRKKFYLAPIVATTLLCSGCANDEFRDNYANKEDCLKEWAEQTCEASPGATAINGAGYTQPYYGPFYQNGANGGRSSVPSFHGAAGTSSAISSSLVSRSGFGHIGGRHSSSS